MILNFIKIQPYDIVFPIQVVTLLILYFGIFALFEMSVKYPKEPNALNDRLGTILFHSTRMPDNQELNPGLIEHVYCYYLREQVYISENDNIFLFKQTNNFKDCQDWLGMLIKYEYYWMNETQNLIVQKQNQ